MPLLLLLLLLVLPATLAGQGLPPYRPINPVAASRSGLSFEPFRDALSGRWAVDVGVEYASTIEHNLRPQASFLLDTELLRIRAGVSRDLGAATFLLAEAEVLGAYAGVLDGALDWYHDLLGIAIPERERRPRNHFLYSADLGGKGSVVREPRDVFLGDLRVGLGLRVHPRVQSVVAVTLPTNTGPHGYGRGVPSAGVLNTARLPITPRFVFEGSLSAGYTPRRGVLAQWQREIFIAGSSGFWWRFSGRQSLFGNFFLHSPYYHGTTVPSLDRRDLSFDFGWMLESNGGGRLRIGMAEDLEPGGPAVDLVFRIGGSL